MSTTRQLNSRSATAPVRPTHGTSICSFPPIESRAARVLVLGSMPGTASLRASQYYAYQHNAFWPIMGALFGAGPEIPYARRIAILRRAGLAVWDVLASCAREGSLDADIEEHSIMPNDFRTFFDTHPRVQQVFFNGSKAETSFNRYVRLNLCERGFRFARLPSPSPAHASLPLSRKLQAWRAVAQALAKKQVNG